MSNSSATFVQLDYSQILILLIIFSSHYPLGTMILSILILKVQHILDFHGFQKPLLKVQSMKQFPICRMETIISLDCD